jgi:hypothetical protein
MGEKEMHFLNVYAQLTILRRNLKCTLPVQIWSYSHELAALQIKHRVGYDALAALPKVTFHALPDVSVESLSWDAVKRSIPPRPWLDDVIGFSTMPKALLLTSFSQVIALDADSVLFINPEELLRTSQVCVHISLVGVLYSLN